jgi:flagellar hook-basal body complex protein FliE
MDGLTIRNANQMLNVDRATSGRNNDDLQISAPQRNDVASPQSFADTLNHAINSVNEMQKIADTKTNELATGQNTNVAEVMIAMEKADIALRTLVGVRNKIIDAYQEVLKMQV